MKKATHTHTHEHTSRELIRRKRMKYNKGRHEPDMFCAYEKQGKKRKEMKSTYDLTKDHTQDHREPCAGYICYPILAHTRISPAIPCAHQPVWLSICLRNVLFLAAPQKQKTHTGKNCVPVSREQPKKWHREAIQQNCANKIDIYGEVKRSELAIWQMLLLLAFFALSSISCVYYSTGQQTYRKKENECSSFSFRSQGELPNGIILLFGSYSAKNNQKICCCCCLFFPVQICALFSCNQV